MKAYYGNSALRTLILESVLEQSVEDSAANLAAAEEEKNKILSKKVASAKELETEILEKAEIEAKSKRERVISGAKLKARNEKLAAKQEVIEEVFSKSVEKLCKLNDREFVKFIKFEIYIYHLQI